MDNDLSLLISRAKSGDENAFADLAVMYKPLTESMGKTYSAKCGNALFSEDDFIQEATLGLYSAVRTYEESDKVTFGLYAKVCVRNRLISLLRTASRKAKTHKNTAKNKGGYTEPFYSFLDKENADVLGSKIESVLSKLEWSVFCLYLERKSYAEIAQILGKSVKTVDNALFRIKKKLKSIHKDL